MITVCRSLILLSLVWSCNNKQSNLSVEDKEHSKDSIIAMLEKDSRIDMRLVAALFTTINKNPDSNFEIYESYDLDKISYNKIIDSAFAAFDSLNFYKEKIESNLEVFIESQRSSVFSSMKNFNSIEGMEFSYLVSRRDSLVPQIVESFFHRSKADSLEKERIFRMLEKEFPDALPKEKK